MRRALTILAVVVVVIVVGLVGVDTAFAINAERSFAKALMTSRASDGESPALRYEPEVTISGFPAVRSITDGHYSAIGITARAVDATGRATFADNRQPRMPRECSRDDPCHVDLRSRLSDVRVGGSSLGKPFSLQFPLEVGSATASTTLDSVAVGRFHGIDDLTVNTPAPQGTPGGGGPQDGLLSRTRGVLLTGSVAPGVDGTKVKVSVKVDLSIVRGALTLTATDFYTGPEEHATTRVAAADRASVLERFSATFPRLPMPWGATPTSARSSGSDLMIEGPAKPEVFGLSLFLDASDVHWMWTCGGSPC